MTQVLITRSKLDSLASAIGVKLEEPLPLTIAEMEALIRGLLNGDPLGYGRNTRALVNIAKAGQAIVKDYIDSTTGRAFSDLAVLSE